MHKIKTSVTNFLKNEGLESKKLLLMVSGGVDSMVMLHAFIKTHPIKLLHVLHINHNTRADNKDDETLVMTICAQQNIPCSIHALTQKPKVNKECYWRKERLFVSNEIATNERCERILTAHHATDLVETVLLRLTKGAGIMGLSPHEKKTKPLYYCTKHEIYEYANTFGIQWNKDSTNSDVKYDRNRVRQNILPELKKITPQVEKVFLRNAFIAEEYSQFVQSQLPKCQQNEIQLHAFQSLHPLLKKEWIRQESNTSISTGELLDALKWLKNPRGMTQKKIGRTLFFVQKGVLYWNEIAG